MEAYDKAEIVKTEGLLGGVVYRLYVFDRHTGKIKTVANLQLTQRDLEHAQVTIDQARMKKSLEDQGELPF